MDDPPAADIEAQARTALVNGQAALLAGDNDAAFRWLDRAHRLVPTDPNVMLALASAWISQDTEWAASLFARVAEAHGVAQAWLGLAACRLRQGDGAEALRSLARVLAEHALPVESIGLIDRIAAETGWCGLHSDGRLEIHPPAGHSPAGRHGKPRVTLDGKPVSKLPRHWPLASRVEVRVGDIHLLGSPIRIDVIRRLVGCVEADDGGITGWAWYPNDPATDPALTLRWPDTNRERRIVARDRGRHFPHTGPLAQVRGFAIPPAELLAGPVHILGLDDRPLLGSPLDPRAAEIPVQVPPSRPGPTRPTPA
ncbi:MAG TPA: hypothetical protein VHB27_15740, partial [Rhodopila sp.]|uniref:tetratricopeptide repeat protein n=1 Tax=Rhodopila sp. TaxID=2480087 RepID=UPI002CC2CDB9|nr:hypothetical protein [Rhodopila sp.]